MLLNGFDMEMWRFMMISGIGSCRVDMPDIPQSMMVEAGIFFELFFLSLA